MAAYDDADGVQFTIQSIRAQSHNLHEIIVVDNNPTSAHGKTTAEFCFKAGVKYIPYTVKKSTSIRNIAIAAATGTHILCVDCHIVLTANTYTRLFTYLNNNKDSDNLFHGVMTDDRFQPVWTHMNPIWDEEFYGSFATDVRGLTLNKEPFEIPMQGLALFACKRDTWLGFHSEFQSFGGEEYYIHEKYRQAGRKVLCLPFVRYWHRFMTPNVRTSPIGTADRLYNYFLGWKELGLKVDNIRDHYTGVRKYSPLFVKAAEERADKVLATFSGKPSYSITKVNDTDANKVICTKPCKFWNNGCVQCKCPDVKKQPWKELPNCPEGYWG